MQNSPIEYIVSDEKSLDDRVFSFSPWDRIFFYGDLGAGKTTFIRKLLQAHFTSPDMIIRSPTYTYYQKYDAHGKVSVYHFDLYRIEDISGFYSIGGMEITSDTNAIMLIEWPEILGDTIIPTKKISIEIMEDAKRKITIT